MTESVNYKHLKENILAFIESTDQSKLEIKDISESLDMTDSKSFKKLVKATAELERQGLVEITPQGYFRLSSENQRLEGTFSGTDRGFGFVIVDEDMEDIFIPKRDVHSAMHGDKVEVEITKKAVDWQDKSAEGKITKIVERSTNLIIGEFTAYSDEEVKDLNCYGYIETNLKKMPTLTVQVEPKGLRPVTGEIVQVEITHYPSHGEDMMGIVKKTIGHKDEPGVDILAIVHKHGIPSEFPQEVVEEAKQVPDQISASDLKQRVDLRDETIITIDGADAKDLDDAISIHRLGNGNIKLGVHIADVSHYVQEGSAMDEEAFLRGTSSYLTDRVIPMLPQRLSNGICSLHPNVDRLTLTCQMEIDRRGEVIDYSIFKSVIQSKQRMTYQAVNEILMDDNAETKKEYTNLVDMFTTMEELHETLLKKRQKRGSIDFDTVEAKVLVDEEGHPKDILVEERGVGERIIESFMLQANETVSKHYYDKHLPILYRVHARPDEQKVQTFLEFVANLGVTVTGTKDTIQPKDLQEVLKDVEGRQEEQVIRMLLLRSMQQAKYDIDPIGHFGLAATYYSHFTSPIRRYPDLILHRLIHYYEEVGTSKKDRERWENKLPEIAEQSSNAERRAIDAERETDELKKTEYMQQHVGEEFMGRIVSIIGFGMFIQLDNTVEGMIHISQMNDDYYEFNERALTMIGTRTGKVFKIGQPIRVKLVKADPEQGEIDFEMVEDFAEHDSSLIKSKKGGRSRSKGEKKAPTNNKHKSKKGKGKAGKSHKHPGKNQKNKKKK